MWRAAQIISSEKAADDIKSILVKPSVWFPHKAGQHYELRIPGSEFSRKYSVVSPPSRTGALEFGIQLIPNGALSPKVWEMKAGSELEIQGPLGESFIWEPTIQGPLLLIGAGSGITPLLSIHDSFREFYPQGTCVFIVSAKTEGKLMHYEKIREKIIPRFTGYEKRIDESFLKETLEPLDRSTSRVYVCGPDGFIDSVVDYLLDLGFTPGNIRSERFI